jgi:hypothetical protein
MDDSRGRPRRRDDDLERRLERRRRRDGRGATRRAGGEAPTATGDRSDRERRRREQPDVAVTRPAASPPAESWSKGFFYDIKATDFAMAIVTGCMLVVALGQNEIASNQNTLVADANRIAGEAAMAAKDASASAEKSVKLAEITAQQQLRAYVFVHKPICHLQPGSNKAQVNFVLKNFGETPARNLRAALLVFVREATTTPGVIDWNNDARELEKHETLAGHLAQGQMFAIAFEAEVEPGLYDQVKANKKGLWVVGYIKYDDSFGRAHRVNVNYYLGNGRGIPRDHSMAISSLGNSEVDDLEGQPVYVTPPGQGAIGVR